MPQNNMQKEIRRMLQKEVKETVLRLGKSRPEDVARKLMLDAMLAGGKSAPPMVEGILRRLGETESDSNIAETYRSVADAVKRLDAAISKPQSTESAPADPRSPEPFGPTIFAKKRIIQFEKETGRTYTLSDLADYLAENGLVLKNKRDLSFTMDSEADTPHGATKVFMRRLWMVGSYDYTVIVSDSPAGHHVLKELERLLLQRASVMYKSTTDPTELVAIFGAKPNESYENDVLSDSTFRLVPYNALSRFEKG